MNNRNGRSLQNQTALDLSPYQSFSPADWSRFRREMPIVLNQQDIEMLQGLNDRLSMDEVDNVYMPLARLVMMYKEAYLELHRSTQSFLQLERKPMPFIIGIAGSVAVGKSTTARLLQELLTQWDRSKKVDLITTDGFLYPNAVLEKKGLMDKKGFPQSFDRKALLTFLSEIKAGKEVVNAPIYSHFDYDILPYQKIKIERPDILIVEGINVLQPGYLPKEGEAIPFVSDFFDFSIYVDAEKRLVEKWYLERFMMLRETAFRDPNSYFHRYSKLDMEEAEQTAIDIWHRINLKNLNQNILPTRQRADLILTKGKDHWVNSIALRKV